MKEADDRKLSVNQLDQLIDALSEAKERVESGEPVEILNIGSRPIVFPASDTIKSGCFEIEVLPDPDILEKQA